MHLELVKPALVDLLEAVRLAQRSLHRTMAMVQVTVRRIVIAGEKLLMHRGEMEHGEWIQYLEINVPDISRETARKWMKLAEFAQHHSTDLESAQSVSHAYRLCGLLPEGESGGMGSGPSKGRQMLNGLTRLAEELKTVTVERLGPEERVILRRRLEPYVLLYERLLAT